MPSTRTPSKPYAGAFCASVEADTVDGLHGDSFADARGLLTEGGNVEADPALACQRKHSVVEDQLQAYTTVQTDRVGFGKLRVETGVWRAVVSNHTEGIDH